MTRLVAWAAAVGAVALGFVPWATLLAGGRDDPQAWAMLAAWWQGTVLVAGLAAAATVLDRRLGLLARRPWEPLVAWAERRPITASWLVAGLAASAYAWLAGVVFDREALLIDEIVQALQGRIFTEGRLARPAFAERAFFSIPLLVDRGGLVFGQFPPGWPAVLGAFELVDARWLAGPVTTGLGIAAAAWWLRAVEPHAPTRWLALLLCAGSPFLAFQAGTQMNHAPATAALVLGLGGTAHALLAPATARATGGGRIGAAFAGGLGFGLAATTRPLDALCFALPAAAWWLVAVTRERGRLGAMLASGAGVALPVAATLWFNWRTTGAPLLFAYLYHWGPSHSIGFHDSPYRTPHTPRLGLELASLYLFRLNRVLYEVPVPALAAPVAAWVLSRRLRAADVTALVACVLLVASYWAYFHDGWYLGPRFLVPVVPVLALWTARLPRLVAERWPGVPSLALRWGLLAAAGVGAGSLWPTAFANYHTGLGTMRLHGEALADAAGVRGALVFVRESWGATLYARMVAREVLPGDVEWVYKRADQCALSQLTDSLERAAVRGAAALAAYERLVGDSLRLRPLPSLVDQSGRFDPGRPLTPACERLAAEEREGFTLLAPRLLDRTDNIYARDLGGRDTLLLRAHPARPVFRLRAAGSEVGAPLIFERLSRDSIVAAARAGR